MTLEEALRAELMTIEGLSNKVHFLDGKEGIVAPYLIIVSSEGKHDKSLEGFHNSKWVPVEFNVINDKYSNMKSLSKLVMDKLKGFEGRKLATTGPYISEIEFDTDSSERFEKEVGLYRKIISTTIYFKEE